MFRKDQKLFGYAKENDEWIEFDSWQLTALWDESDVEYRIWKSKYEKKIHVIRDESSPLIHFNRKHRTFSYFPNAEGTYNSSNSPVSLSHVLRQKVISERSSATFSLQNIIHKRNKVREEHSIVFKKIYLDQKVEIDGDTYIPDIIIEFEEPDKLALKWNNKLVVEIVESNETIGTKIEAYRKLGYGVIEIPYTPAFDIFEKRNFSEITRNDVKELLRKIENYYNKSIWADLIVDPISDDYKRFMIESKIVQENIQLDKKLNLLKGENSQFKKDNTDLLDIIATLKNELENLNGKHLSIIKKFSEAEQITIHLKNTIERWNNSSFFDKLFHQFKIKI